MMKVSVLCDDTVASGEFLAEHGLALLIELRNGHRWLLDTGTTDVFLENAARMGESLDGLSGVVISHGHDDHAGGLTFYPRLEGSPPVYGHPHIWQKQYQVAKGAPVRVLGLPPLARKFADPVFRAVQRATGLDEDLYFFTDIPREPGSYAPTEGKFFNEDGTGPCPIADDGTLVARTPRGLVALFGCAHAGYVNILEAIRKEFPADRLLSVLGGLHLGNAGDRALAEAIACTNAFKADGFTFYGGHCTGGKAIAAFRGAFGDGAVHSLGAGRAIIF